MRNAHTVIHCFVLSLLLVGVQSRNVLQDALATESPSEAPTASPSISPSPTSSPYLIESLYPDDVSPSPSWSASSSSLPSITALSSINPSSSIIPSIFSSSSPSISPSETPSSSLLTSITPSQSSTVTPSTTTSNIPSISSSSSPSVSPSATPSATASSSSSVSPSLMPSVSPSKQPQIQDSFIIIELQMSGNIGGFDSNSFKETLASILNVPSSIIQVTSTTQKDFFVKIKIFDTLTMNSKDLAILLQQKIDSQDPQIQQAGILDIISIQSSDSQTGKNPSSNSKTGIIVGTVIGVFALLVLAGAVVLVVVRKKKKEKQEERRKKRMYFEDRMELPDSKHGTVRLSLEVLKTD